jgi:hypothetical protein
LALDEERLETYPEAVAAREKDSRAEEAPEVEKGYSATRRDRKAADLRQGPKMGR